MKAARVLRFGPPTVITREDIPQPQPGAIGATTMIYAARSGVRDIAYEAECRS